MHRHEIPSPCATHLFRLLQKFGQQGCHAPAFTARTRRQLLAPDNLAMLAVFLRLVGILPESAANYALTIFNVLVILHGGSGFASSLSMHALAAATTLTVRSMISAYARCI